MFFCQKIIVYESCSNFIETILTLKIWNTNYETNYIFEDVFVVKDNQLISKHKYVLVKSDKISLKYVLFTPNLELRGAGPSELGAGGLSFLQILEDTLKFGLSEKHTKFEKIFLMVWMSTKSKYKAWGRFR